MPAAAQTCSFENVNPRYEGTSVQLAAHLPSAPVTHANVTRYGLSLI